MSDVRTESERATRRERIVPKLAVQGWRVSALNTNHVPGISEPEAIAEFPTESGPADYALCFDTRVAGVVEATRVTVGPQNVLTEAARYAQGVREGTGAYGEGLKVPFLYSTNGAIIWFQDGRDPLNPSRKIKALHTPSALREMLLRDDRKCLETLTRMPFRPDSVRQIKKRECKLGGFKWIKDESHDHADDEEIIAEAVTQLTAAIDELNQALKLLEKPEKVEA